MNHQIIFSDQENKIKLGPASFLWFVELSWKKEKGLACNVFFHNFISVMIPLCLNKTI